MGLKRERAEAVIRDLYECNSLTKVLKKHGVNAQNFFHLLADVPSLDEAYVRAQKARAEIFVDEIIEIADTERDPQTARNRIDARKWCASKMKPDKFGERIDVNLNQTVDIRGALSEAKNRIREILEIPLVQIAETAEAIDSSVAGSKPATDGSTAKNELDELLD